MRGRHLGRRRAAPRSRVSKPPCPPRRALHQAHGKSCCDGGLPYNALMVSVLDLEAECRRSRATRTVAFAPPAATLSNSRAFWLTGVLGLTGGLLLVARVYASSAENRQVGARPIAESGYDAPLSPQ